MWIELLRLERLRRVAFAELTLAPGGNLLLGPNGAGKTTILEAASVLSYGRSFRRGARDALTRRGCSGFQVFARIRRAEGGTVRLGIGREKGAWSGRLDDRPVARLSDLFAACAVCCFEPGSHELIAGPAEGRRAALDWGVFHVEPDFLPVWRRYQRALKQRNAVLKAGAGTDELSAWEPELAQAGAALTAQRQAYMARLGDRFAGICARLIPELGAGNLRFDIGWAGEGSATSLAEALVANRDRDRLRQTTRRGPHRADWTPVFDEAPAREHLSRGQEKLTALAVMLAQAELHRESRGEWPVIALDDLPSELDYAHQQELLGALLASGAQLLITGTEASPPLEAVRDRLRVFHVEQGSVAPA